MLRLILIAMTATVLVAAGGGVSRAEMTIYVEDFENDGEPGFDPMFNHEFTGEYHEPYWELCENSYFAEHGTVLGLWGSQDAVSFNLPEGQEVVYASVDVAIWNRPSYDYIYSIDFVGTLGEQRVYLTETDSFITIGMACHKIGPITEIRMRSSEGYYDNITLHVVPEPSPSVWILFLGMWCLWFVLKNRLQRQM